MNDFNLGETVICLIEVKDGSGAFVDPATSMTVTIWDPGNAKVIDVQAMVKDSIGKYHYDYTPTIKTGTYIIKYIAIDSSRISIQKDNFTVV